MHEGTEEGRKSSVPDEVRTGYRLRQLVPFPVARSVDTVTAVTFSALKCGPLRRPILMVARRPGDSLAVVTQAGAELNTHCWSEVQVGLKLGVCGR